MTAPESGSANFRQHDIGLHLAELTDSAEIPRLASLDQSARAASMYSCSQPFSGNRRVIGMLTSGASRVVTYSAFSRR